MPNCKHDLQQTISIDILTQEVLRLCETCRGFIRNNTFAGHLNDLEFAGQHFNSETFQHSMFRVNLEATAHRLSNA